MNYRDYFKKEEISAKLKDAPSLSNVNPEELKKGTEHEMEHTTDRRTAEVIAKQHLKDDPHYYSKMDKAGLDECGEQIDANGGLPKLGGALAIPHVGQPIHMSKIIQVGPLGASSTASGALSGMTPCPKKGVNADKGGVKVSQDGDRETITAGGKKLDASIATKSVGGQVVAGEGEKQGGPNTKGTYANTVKMSEGGDQSQTPRKGEDITISLQEHKNVIRKAVKEALKEIAFNKKTGRWERIDELSIPGSVPNIPDDPEEDPVDRSGDYGEIPGENPIGEAHDEEVGRNAGQSEGGFKPNVFEMDMKMGPSYKGPAGRQYRVADDDQARAVQYEPEITETYDSEEEEKLQEQYFNLLTKKDLLKESEMAQMNKIRERLEHQRQLREELNMKMGPSYKVNKGKSSARCSQCDQARTVQYDPEMTEGSLSEAGGAAENNTSYRTANDAPQIPKNRHRGDIDEQFGQESDEEPTCVDCGKPADPQDFDQTGGRCHSCAEKEARLTETTKTSKATQTIKRVGKAKAGSKKQNLAYKEPKKTKSGVQKKRK